MRAAVAVCESAPHHRDEVRRPPHPAQLLHAPLLAVPHVPTVHSRVVAARPLLRNPEHVLGDHVVGVKQRGRHLAPEEVGVGSFQTPPVRVLLPMGGSLAEVFFFFCEGEAQDWGCVSMWWCGVVHFLG